VAVDADRQYLNLLFFVLGQKAFQLPELLGAVGSPMSAIKDQHDVFLTSEVGKGNLLSVHVLKSKVRRCISHFDSFEVRGLQVFPFFGA
jgi:hypothetical protein